MVIHGEDVITGGELQILVVGGPFPVDPGNLVEAGGIGFEVEAWVSGLDPLHGVFARNSRAARDAGVRRIQLTDHFHDEVMEFFEVGNVRQQRFVLVLGRRPVHTMHAGVIEAILHHAPRFCENLALFRDCVDFHAQRKVDAARRCPACRCGVGNGSPPACTATSATTSTSACRAGIGRRRRDSHRIQATA